MMDSLWDAYRSRIVYGFHGNRRLRIDELIARGFRRDPRDGDWLGNGFYYWQDAPVRAREWAEWTTARRGVGPNAAPAVLLSALKITERWVDLIESTVWFDRFRNAASELDVQGRLPAQAWSPGLSRPHRRDYAIIEHAVNMASTLDIRIDALRAAFVEGRPISEGSAIFDKAHVQIVVRDPDAVVVRSEFIPR